jgi:hypothetical protein
MPLAPGAMFRVIWIKSLRGCHDQAVQCGPTLFPVTLVREIQGGATDASTPLSELLRKAKILAVRLGNLRLEEWVDKELNGYPTSDPLPPYRRVGPNRVLGHFAGPFGSGLRNGEIPSALIESEDEENLFNHRFLEGVAHYESILADRAEDADLLVHWPGNALLKYANRIYDGLTLMSAMQQLSPASIAGLLDGVRNRLLELALEVERENPDAGEAPIGSQPVAPAQVERIVQNVLVYGGQNTIAAGQVTQQVQQITTGSTWDEMRRALEEIGVPADDIAQLRVALECDGEATVAGELGPAAQGWIGRIASRVATGALHLAQGVTVEVLTQVVLRTLGQRG